MTTMKCNCQRDMPYIDCTHEITCPLYTPMISAYQRNMIGNINAIVNMIHKQNEKWWVDLETGEPIRRNFGELIALAHSELSEALEGDRKNLMDDKLPYRKMVEVELTDAVIRIFDMAGGLGLDLGAAIIEKQAYNQTRQDHTREHRLSENGKKY